MNKFLFVFVSLCLFAPIQGLRRNRLKEFHRRRLNGDLHPKHRRLSEAGQLHLKVDGRGYFQYRLRVSETDASDDESQQDAEANKKYDQAYSSQSAQALGDSGTFSTASNTASVTVNNLNEDLSKGQRVSITGSTCEVKGTYTVTSDVSKGTGASVPLKPAFTSTNTAGCSLVVNPRQNEGVNAGSSDGMGVEAAVDGDNEFFSQVVYSHDGSLHVNKFGYLVDDNGLLLVSQGRSGNTDPNSKFHIHIPSRADNIIVTPTGKVMAVELGGAAFSKVGQIRLARFENAQGLNIRLKMRSNCNAANEDGFALGNWCAGTELDGKEHTYYAETEVSGPGILGNPGHQGFGRIVKS